MSPTIFDSSQNEEQKRREELEQEIEVQKELARQKASTSLPAREEAIIESTEVRDRESFQEIPEHQETQPIAVTQSEEDDSMSTEPQENRDERETPESTDIPESVETNAVSEPQSETPHRDPEEYSELIRTEKPTRNPFAALSIRPANTYFDSQHAQEEILMVLRQHPIVNAGWMILSFVLILLPFTLFPMLPLFSLIPDRFQFFALIGWYLLVLAYMIESFLYWYFNIYIITDERIVDVDFYSLIYRALSSAKIDNIQDTTATTKGVLGAVFNYGDVTIQTAAEKREFEFLKVPQPATVTKFLNELILEEEREKLEGRIM
jgi:hypothetical protein